jgi:hypothetical protein
VEKVEFASSFVGVVLKKLVVLEMEFRKLDTTEYRCECLETGTPILKKNKKHFF